MVYNVISTLLTIAAFMFMVLVHELGHFWAGRACGCRANAFSIGFGPALWSKTDKKGTQWSIRAFPLGGYCSFDDSNEARKRSEAARAAGCGRLESMVAGMRDGKLDALHPLKRMVVYLSGPMANILLALLLSFLAYWMLGTGHWQPAIREVVAGGQAAAAGMLDGDVIMSVNGVPMEEDQSIKEVLQAEAKRLNAHLDVEAPLPLDFKVQHPDGSVEVLNVQALYEEETELWKIGVYQERIAVHGDILSYMLAAVKDLSWQVSGIYKSLVDLIRGLISPQEVMGIVGAVGSVSPYAKPSTAAIFLMLMSLFSANLAVVNLLPVPGLDGFHSLSALLEVATKRKLPAKVTLVACLVCMAALLALTALLVLKDVIFLIM